MKLSGNKRKGRHLPGSADRRTAPGVSDDTEQNDGENTDKSTGRKFRITKAFWKKVIIGAALIVGISIVVLVMDVFADTGIIIKPPPVNTEPRPGATLPEYDGPGASLIPDQITTIDPVVSGDPAEPNLRKPNTFTFLLFGTDSFSNTDVIMTVTFDAENHKLYVASIPRDTMVNVSWTPKKVNTIVYNTRQKFKGQEDADAKTMAATKKAFADLFGYEVDYWFSVDMRGFVALIDAIGGVDFYIPVDMNYHDDVQNLHISYSKGMKRGITGQQALEILRFRKGYANQDIGRIETQQNFLKAVAEQMLAKKSSIDIKTLAEVFFKHLKTDLPLNNLIWLGMEFMQLKSDDISFVTLPGNGQETVNSASYVSIYVDQWLEIINTMLNPYTKDVKDTDVSILTRGADRKLYVTDGNYAGDPSWGASSRGPSTSSSSGSSSTGSSGNAKIEQPSEIGDDVPDINPAAEGEQAEGERQDVPEITDEPPLQQEPSPGNDSPPSEDQPEGN